MDRTQEWGPDSLALVGLLILHVVATTVFLPPKEVLRPEPLETIDFPVHTHRVHVYREALEASGVPWGYDPLISAGSVFSPGKDVGAKFFQAFGVLLFFLEPGAVVRLVLFLSVLTAPFWVYFGCRLLRIPSQHYPWILLMLIGPAWIDPRIASFWHWGLVGFMCASFFSLFVFGLFWRILEKPRPGTYVALSAASAILVLMHAVGPVAILPALLFGLLYVPLPNRWRLLLVAVPIIVAIANAFWLYPFVLAKYIPEIPGYVPHYPADSVRHLHFGEGSELQSPFTHFRSLGPILGASGLAVLGLRVLMRSGHKGKALAIGITCFFGLLLTLFGSNVPLVMSMQPVRFIIPTFVFMSIPVGIAVQSIASLIPTLGHRPALAAATVVAIVVALLTGAPEPLELSDSGRLASWVKHNTFPDDRLMIQSTDGYKYGDYQSKIYPLTLDREVIGSNFPHIYDPPQFLRTTLLGREISDWDPAKLGPTLQLWGVAWVFATTPDANDLMKKTLGDAEASIGEHRAYRVTPAPSRFLVGSGQVEAAINRLDLRNLTSDNGRVVVRYRYHPAWRSEPESSIGRHATKDDPSGFIVLIDPPEAVTLSFDPMGLFSEEWPTNTSNENQ